MHINSIEIRNFRRFENFKCECHPRLTLLMGSNGSGKTSVLKATCMGLAGGMQQAGVHMPLDLEDVRRVNAVDPSNESWRTAVFPCQIGLRLTEGLNQIELWRVRTPTTDLPFIQDGAHPSLQGHQAFNVLVQSWFNPSHSPSIPLFARFGASNSWSGNGRAGQIRKPFENKQEIWHRFSSDSIDIGGLAQWFQYNELRSLQEGTQPLVYRVAKQAVLAAIHAEDINYVVRDNQLMVKHAEHGWRPFEQLSDGQRRLAAIFTELAMRAASLNSQLGEDCIRETTGVVLIDELDLHLHPQWQRSVIDNLLSVFPKLQFVVASHSPFLLQSAFEHGIVVDVATGQPVSPGDPSIEDIAENVMGVEQPQRSRRFLEMKQLAQKYLELLETPTHTPEQKAVLKQKLDEALAVFANDPAAAAWLEQRRSAKGL